METKKYNSFFASPFQLLSFQLVTFNGLLWARQRMERKKHDGRRRSFMCNNQIYQVFVRVKKCKNCNPKGMWTMEFDFEKRRQTMMKRLELRYCHIFWNCDTTVLFHLFPSIESVWRKLNETDVSNRTIKEQNSWKWKMIILTLFWLLMKYTVSEEEEVVKLFQSFFLSQASTAINCLFPSPSSFLLFAPRVSQSF